MKMKEFGLVMIGMLLIVLCAIMATTVKAEPKMTKCTQLQQGLLDLATFHEQQEQGGSATPEVVTALEGVVADERALADGACQ